MQTIVVKKQSSATRRISLESDWFDYHLDSIVYSFMLVGATARIKPGQKKDGSQSFLYLSQSKYKKLRPIIKKVIGKTARQVGERVQKLIDAGYVKYDEQAKEYTFPYNYNENYYIVSVDVLAYLCTVSNPFVIKIYFYLADKYKFKTDYTFTLTELRQMLGYSKSANSRVNDLIKVALSALSVMKFIEYKKVWVKIPGNATNRPVEQFQLIHVVGKRLPKVIEEELVNNLSLQSKNIVKLLSID